MEGAAEAVVNQGVAGLDSFNGFGHRQVICEFEYMSIESPNLDAEVELPIESADRPRAVDLVRDGTGSWGWLLNGAG